MGKRYLVVGGFEPSGHDAICEAILEAGTDRDDCIDSHVWRNIAPLDCHPIFRLHRRAAAIGEAQVAGLLDEGWIKSTLAEDLSHLVPMGYDAYVSVHPWSTAILAEALRSVPSAESRLIDYHAEFTSFPIVIDPRVDVYLGGGPVHPHAPPIRKRSRSIGVAVRKRFLSESTATSRESRLAVSAGADGWAIRALAPAVKQLQKTLSIEHVLLLAPNEQAALQWRKLNIAGSEVLIGVSDISSLLLSSRWYLSKGGGVSVAEGMAAGCITFVAESGIFWEDDAAHRLRSLRIALDPGITAYSEDLLDGRLIGLERLRCASAATDLWRTVTDPSHDRRLPFEEFQLLAGLLPIGDVDRKLLPKTSIALERRLDEWLEAWQER